MSADGLVQFPIDVVLRHAGEVTQVSEAMRTAQSAVHQVSMDSQAYGVICQFLPALLTPVFDLGVDALRGSVEALQETAAGLRGAAADTEATDAGNARAIGAAGRSPGSALELPL
ncbi:type VII secretion target [Krasilnikovia sp. MM14-A1004]|uniref:type VII secretion target n=1 Tax=Krasilnikovia sp. MM14-A1004 TaxID=3373541 RepID=UPI00399C574E